MMGVKIDTVCDGSIAQRSGLRCGDVVVRVEGIDVTNPVMMFEELHKQKSRATQAKIKLMRDGCEYDINLVF